MLEKTKNKDEILKFYGKGKIKDNTKRGSGLYECIGIIKEDKEWEESQKLLKKGWKKWTKDLAKQV